MRNAVETVARMIRHKAAGQVARIACHYAYAVAAALLLTIAEQPALAIGVGWTIVLVSFVREM